MTDGRRPAVFDDTPCELGEGPVWDAATATLLWVDIPRGHVHRRAPGGERHTLELHTSVGTVAPRAGGGIVAATREGFVLLGADGQEEGRVPVEADVPTNRFNDGKVDARGRFFAGTTQDDHAPGHGAFYRLDPDGAVERLLRDLALPNGLDWSADGGTLHLIDSGDHTVWAFAFDAETGRLGERRELIRLDPALGTPDGMTADAQGVLWIAFYDGGCVRAFDPGGEQVDELPVPVARPTSCTFGGPELDQLFVTSAAGPDGTAGGTTFVAATGRRGAPRAAFAG
jgi:sugar lactone lactonase YvrE